MKFGVVTGAPDSPSEGTRRNFTAALACWVPVPLIMKTFGRCCWTRSLELAAGINMGMPARLKMGSVGSVGRVGSIVSRRCWAAASIAW